MPLFKEIEKVLAQQSAPSQRFGPGSGIQTQGGTPGAARLQFLFHESPRFHQVLPPVPVRNTEFKVVPTRIGCVDDVHPNKQLALARLHYSAPRHAASQIRGSSPTKCISHIMAESPGEVITDPQGGEHAHQALPYVDARAGPRSDAQAHAHAKDAVSFKGMVSRQQAEQQRHRQASLAAAREAEASSYSRCMQCWSSCRAPAC